jgi:hypothetical protein
MPVNMIQVCKSITNTSMNIFSIWIIPIRPPAYRLVWAKLKTIASSAILDLKIFYHIILQQKHHVFMGPIESWWRDLSIDISVDIGVQNLTPNHPFPLQSTDVAASDSFWSPPPRNSYRPQFGTASPITIPLIYSWYGPLVGIVSMFTFE